jgi:hypothetical protein
MRGGRFFLKETSPPLSLMTTYRMSLNVAQIHEGLAKCIERSVNEVRRFSAMFKNTVSSIPLAPPPLCGIPDADTVRSLYDYTLWLDSLPEYGLLGYNAVLRQILVNTRSDPINHVPGRVVLLTSLYGFEKKLFERQGWQGLPGSVPPLSPQDEEALLTPALEGLSTQFRMNIDTLPNLSRDNTIFPTGPTTVEEDMAALFIGGSNDDRLANSAATLGILAETITTAGWVLSTDAVTAILPQMSELCGSLPVGAPVVIYCLDNSSFCCANRDGQLSAIAKQKDGLFHVPGEIVVVHEVTLAAAVTNLKRLLVACGDRMVFIITPGPRYHGIPCCSSGDHCTHLQIPESGIKLMQDLARLHHFISRRLSSNANCSVLPACDLLTGKKNASPEEALAAFSTWGAVHGSSSNHTRMALCLVDNHFCKLPVSAAAAAQPAPPAPPTKRPHADSSSS